MLATAIIVFREVLEAALIIGIVLAATQGLARRVSWISMGIMAGVAGAGLVAWFADAISSALAGVGRKFSTRGSCFSRLSCSAGTTCG